MPKKALGRGIDALFGEEAAPEVPHPGVPASGDRGPQVLNVPVSRIRPSTDQPRQLFDEGAISELARSIKKQGILQPIIVTPAPEGAYTVVAGERRFRAAKLAGLDTVPAVVRQADRKERLEIALMENLQREDLTPIEEALAYRQLMKVSEVDQEALGELVGKDRSTVSNSLRLLKLPSEMQEAVGRREVSSGHARALLSVVNPADQRVLFERIRARGLSVRQAEEEAARLNKGRRIPGNKGVEARRVQDAHLVAVEKRLFDRLGTKVEVGGNLRRGTIKVSYFSAEDLDRIIALMLGEVGPG